MRGVNYQKILLRAFVCGRKNALQIQVKSALGQSLKLSVNLDNNGDFKDQLKTELSNKAAKCRGNEADTGFQALPKLKCFKPSVLSISLGPNLADCIAYQLWYPMICFSRWKAYYIGLYLRTKFYLIEQF